MGKEERFYKNSTYRFEQSQCGHLHVLKVVRAVGQFQSQDKVGHALAWY